MAGRLPAVRIMAGSTRHLSKEDWVVGALEILRTAGIRGVKIERVAKSLGVTKGSFYWHFDSREALLAAILTYWSEHLVESISEALLSAPSDPAEELVWMASRVISERLNEHDQAIRTWAKHDPVAAEVVREVDENRLAYKRDLFRKVGFDECEADLRSRMTYFYTIGEEVVAFDVPVAERLERVKDRYRLLGAG
jgi:AcrR family transcriptional regulator